MKLNNFLEILMTKATTRLAFVFLFLLTLTSFFTMTRIAYVNELTTLTFNPVGPILATAIYYLITFKASNLIKSTKKLQLYGAVLILGYCLSIFLIGPTPYNDQGALVDVLTYLSAGVSDVLYADYLRIWNGQYKLIMVFQLLGSNYTLFYLINIAGYVGAYFLLPSIIDKMTLKFDGEKKEKTLRSAIVAYTTFIPLALYTNFYYGESLSITMFFVIVNSLLNIFNKEETLKDYIVIPVAILFAALLRDFTLILLIAVSAVLLIKSDKERFLKRLIVVLSSWLMILVSSSIVNTYYKVRYDFEIKNYNSHLTWVAMGLMDRDDYATEKEMVYSQEGGHNSYNYDIVLDNDFDQEAVSTQAKEAIKEELTEFVQNPIMAAKFFFNKMSKQWTEANFAGNVGISYLEEGTSEFVIWLYTSFIRDGYEWFVKGYYCFMMLSLVVYLKNNMNNLSEIELVLLMFFVGGFLFSSFWEAKPRYNLPYFTMLIPVFSIASTQMDDRLEVIIGRLSAYLKKRKEA